MERCYINGMGCISVQNTFEGDFLEHPIVYSDTNKIYAVKPNYKAFIPPAAIRRMSSGVKNSIVASALAIEQAQVHELDGIITGTGMGCIQRSEEHTSELQSRPHLVCRLLLEKKKKKTKILTLTKDLHMVSEFGARVSRAKPMQLASLESEPSVLISCYRLDEAWASSGRVPHV